MPLQKLSGLAILVSLQECGGFSEYNLTQGNQNQACIPLHRMQLHAINPLIKQYQLDLPRVVVLFEYISVRTCRQEISNKVVLQKFLEPVYAPFSVTIPVQVNFFLFQFCYTTLKMLFLLREFYLKIIMSSWSIFLTQLP